MVGYVRKAHMIFHIMKSVCAPIDPIDELRFYKGGNNWSHSLPLIKMVEKGSSCRKPPRQDLIFSAYLGGGSWLNGDRIQIKAVNKTGEFDLIAAKLVEDDKI